MNLRIFEGWQIKGDVSHELQQCEEIVDKSIRNKLSLVTALEGKFAGILS